MIVKVFNWSEEKNSELIQNRDISFEEIVFYIEQGNLVDVVKHPNLKKYPNQKIFVVNIDGYAFLVPFIESTEEIFLKTIIPSRKATKEYKNEMEE